MAVTFASARHSIASNDHNKKGPQSRKNFRALKNSEAQQTTTFLQAIFNPLETFECLVKIHRDYRKIKNFTPIFFSKWLAKKSKN